MNMQTTLGNALIKELVTLRQQKGELSIEDVGAMLTGVASSLQASGKEDAFLRNEISRLAEYIKAARQEILALGGASEENKGKDAADQLHAIVKTTEEASNTIMDAADTIQTLASQVGGETGSKLCEETNRLYEACNFQDLTGQRITKVAGYLQAIDVHMAKILAYFGAADTIVGQNTSATVIPMDEKSLLNGPQLPDAAPSQADIDKLFDS